MEPLPRNNHVFVDCENIHQIDPSHIGSKTVKFHFLFGVNQKRLDMDAVEKISQHAETVEIIRLTSSGKNALDFILSYHVGRAAITDPMAYFHIVSGDTGYRPLIEHLSRTGIQVQLHVDFSTLTFSRLRKLPAQSTPPSHPNLAFVRSQKKTIAVISKDHPKDTDTLTRIRKHLLSAKPKKETALITVLAGHLNLPPTDKTIQPLIKSLESENFLKIDAEKKITYPPEREPNAPSPIHV